MDLDDFQCKCGDHAEVAQPDIALSIMIRNAEKHFKREVIISSGFRCSPWNKRWGGSPNSYHCKKMAVDVYIPGIELQELYDWFDQGMYRCGLGIYKSHVHVDSRNKDVRWDMRT